MNRIERLAYERIPSFRREDGGLYGAYVAVYSRAYGLAMRWRHRGAGRSAYRVIEAPPMPLAEFAALVSERTTAMQAHCRRRPRFCTW